MTSTYYFKMSATEFQYIQMLAASPIVEVDNPTMYHFARSLLERAYEHVERVECWDNEGKFLFCFLFFSLFSYVFFLFEGDNQEEIWSTEAVGKQSKI